MSSRVLLIVLVAACHSHQPPPVVAPPAREAPLRRLPPRQGSGPLTAAERDSLVREVQTRRAAWRARGITAYSLRVGVGCFCPGPSGPATLEVRRGVVVSIRDAAGKTGPPREPWSPYTVEGLFDAVEDGTRRFDVIEVAWDSLDGYPATIRADAKVGLPDDWFVITASQLTPLRP
jgi:hypothetical protein